MRSHTLILLALWLCCSSPLAQAGGDGHNKRKRETPPPIEKIVTDLTTAQKKKIDQIRRESSERIVKLEEQQRQVRDSIRLYMDRYEDNSKVIFPLIERESALLTAINKEMYRTKCQLNKVLTVEQHDKLLTHMRAHRHKNKGEPR